MQPCIQTFTENKACEKRDGSDGIEHVYVEFEPFLLHQHKQQHHIQFETFDAALDEFFSKV